MDMVFNRFYCQDRVKVVACDNSCNFNMSEVKKDVGCYRHDLSETNYQDHHLLKIKYRGPRSFLGSFLNSSGVKSFLRSFLDSSGITPRNKPLLLICLVAKETTFE